jgi:hypothetical protein
LWLCILGYLLWTVDKRIDKKLWNAMKEFHAAMEEDYPEFQPPPETELLQH